MDANLKATIRAALPVAALELTRLLGGFIPDEFKQLVEGAPSPLSKTA